ncbi:MAG: class I SAM-dependent methyltransferase [Acidimicrobiales bacterium]
MSVYPLKLSDIELARYELMAAHAREAEADLWAAAGIVAGATIADIGCGPGAVSVALAREVGPGGRVLAFDRTAEAVTMARAVAERAGVANVTVEAASADATPVPPGSVDVVMIRHVLAHNGGLEAAIVGHAATLVRRGGCVYLIDIDMTALRTRPTDPDIDDLNARYNEWHDRQGNDLSVGLRLSELLEGAALETVEFRGRYDIVAAPPGFRPPSLAAKDSLASAGLATDDDVARWEAAFSRFDALDPRPVVFAPIFCAIGRRPTGS